MDTAKALRYAAIGLAVLGALIGSCKCCAKTCSGGDNFVAQPRVGVNPARTDNIELQHVQNNGNLEEAHEQNTGNHDESHVLENVSYRDEQPTTVFPVPPTYNAAYNGTNDVPAMPPPSYDEVVSPDNSADQ